MKISERYSLLQANVNQKLFAMCLQLQQTITGHAVNVNMVTVMCGISKVIVGELIETGKVVLHCMCYRTLACAYTSTMSQDDLRSVDAPHLSPLWHRFGVWHVKVALV